MDLLTALRDMGIPTDRSHPASNYLMRRFARTLWQHQPQSLAWSELINTDPIKPVEAALISTRL